MKCEAFVASLLVLLLILLNKSGLIKRKQTEVKETKQRRSRIRSKKSTEVNYVLKEPERERHIDRFSKSVQQFTIHTHIYPIDCLVMFTLSSSNPFHALTQWLFRRFLIESITTMAWLYSKGFLNALMNSI